MNPIFNNFTNPLQEHIARDETIRRQNTNIVYCLIICLCLLISYLVIKSQFETRTKEEETKDL
jgi:hypothetical protein